MKEAISHINQRMASAAIACGRKPEAVKLVAVSKTVPVEHIQAAIDAGLRTFGENYVQEARDKIRQLQDQVVSWHFIGRLQTNKAKHAVPWFDMIHTVDSEKLAREIDRQAKKNGKIQNILVQVNVGGEASKAGVSPEDAESLIRAISPLENLAVKGLMTIPPFFDSPETVRPYFRQLAKLRDRIQNQCIPRISMQELSMGMTGDFETAIEQGATLVRIGTAIFGERS